jgi:hypothetical protein
MIEMSSLLDLRGLHSTTLLLWVMLPLGPTCCIALAGFTQGQVMTMMKNQYDSTSTWDTPLHSETNPFREILFPCQIRRKVLELDGQ